MPRSNRRPATSRGGRVALALAFLTGLLLAALPVGLWGGGAAAARPNPFAGANWDASTSAGVKQKANELRQAGNAADAALLDYIAGQQVGDWITDTAPWNACCGGVQGFADRIVMTRLANGAVPILVLYYLPTRDCSGNSGGGAPNAASYAAWIDQIATGIGNRKAVVLLEPDGLTVADCDPSQGGNQYPARYVMLSAAVARLKQNPNAYVYLEGGHNDALTVTAMVNHLKLSGIGLADGFFLNVALYQYTTAEVAYGRAISQALAAQGIADKRFIVDTGRNGLGPLPDSFKNQWCTPPVRALGVAPTIATGEPLADAFLWVKPVWQSDGNCGRGGNEPNPGEPYWDYAIALARNAQRPFRDWDTISATAQPLVRQLGRLGVIRGNGDGDTARNLTPTFGATETTKRAQMAALIARPAFWEFETWTDKNFSDQSGVDNALWRNVRTLAHYNVAKGYDDGTFRPLDPVLYQQVILFISRSMVTRGCWPVWQPDDRSIFPNLPADSPAAVADRRDLVTFVFYTRNYGGVPDHNPQASFADYAQPAPREWFARALYAALASCAPQAIDYPAPSIP